MKSEGPKFEVGDLVQFKQEFLGFIESGLGIIISKPVLVFEHEWPDDFGYSNQVWTYDIKIGTNLFKMIPEEFIKGLEKNDNEEDSK